MLRRLIGLVWTATIVSVLVRKFAPDVWTSGVRFVREKAVGAKGPDLSPTRTDRSPAEVGLVPDPNAAVTARPTVSASSV